MPWQPVRAEGRAPRRQYPIRCARPSRRTTAEARSRELPLVIPMTHPGSLMASSPSPFSIAIRVRSMNPLCAESSVRSSVDSVNLGAADARGAASAQQRIAAERRRMRRPSAVSVAHHRIDFPSPSSNRFPRPPPRSLPGHSMLRTFHTAGIIGTVGEQPRCSLTALRHCSSAYSSVRVHRLGASARWESCASACRRGGAPVTPVAAGVVWAHCTRVGCCWRRVGGTPRRWALRAVRTTIGQWIPTLVQ